MKVHDPVSLQARVAALLGWSVEDAQSTSLQSLRDLVRPLSPKLAAELTREIQSGRVVIGEPFSCDCDVHRAAGMHKR